jgi:DNA polymerase
MYEDISWLLSQLIRTVFIASPGNVLSACDFSAIEARVIAWLANEIWRQKVFASHGKIYEASAAAMFGCSIEAVSKDMRQKGKIAELALGYQGGKNALERMGGKAMGLSEADMFSLVTVWRRANPSIVKLWADVNSCAIEAITTGSSQMQWLKFNMVKGSLLITLPSGRQLCYYKAAIANNSVEYMGLNQETKQWTKQTTYGGKFVENIVQAIARDILADAMLDADKAGLNIVMHVHDEIVTDGPETDLAILEAIMSRPIKWAPGLIIKAEGFTTKYYKK